MLKCGEPATVEGGAGKNSVTNRDWGATLTQWSTMATIKLLWHKHVELNSWAIFFVFHLLISIQ